MLGRCRRRNGETMPYPKNSVAPRRARRGRTGRREPPSCDLKLAGTAFASLTAEGDVELWSDERSRLVTLTADRIAFLLRLADEMIGPGITLCATEDVADSVCLTIRRSRLPMGAGIRELVIEDATETDSRIVIEMDTLAMLVRERADQRAA